MFGRLHADGPYQYAFADFHPWLVQIKQDFTALFDFDDFRPVAEVLVEAPVRLFLDLELAAEYCSFDFSILRSSFFAASVPPPGTKQDDETIEDPEIRDYRGNYKCNQELSDGTRCTYTCETLHALLAHQRTALKHTPPILSLIHI